jgi:hypothetical protein
MSDLPSVRPGAWSVPGNPELVLEHQLALPPLGALGGEEGGDRGWVRCGPGSRVAQAPDQEPGEAREPPPPVGKELIERGYWRALHAWPELVAGVAGVGELRGCGAVLLHRGAGARRHLRDHLDSADALGVVEVELQA